MQQFMFVIYDSKANAFMTPWFLTTEQLAIRAFGDLANDPESNVFRHPDDYTLFTIGTFNDATAKINWNEPQTLGNAIQFKDQRQKQTGLTLENQDQYENQTGPAGEGLKTKTKKNQHDTAE